jgi:hypothetical protein
MSGASDRVLALKPINFAWISSGERVDGFLAHELAEVVPEAVVGTKDAMRDEEYEVTAAVLDADGMVVTEAVMGTRSVPDMQGIDQSKLVPLLTAALQEALTKIASDGNTPSSTGGKLTWHIKVASRESDSKQIHLHCHGQPDNFLWHR